MLLILPGMMAANERDGIRRVWFRYDLSGDYDLVWNARDDLRRSVEQSERTALGHGELHINSQGPKKESGLKKAVGRPRTSDLDSMQQRFSYVAMLACNNDRYGTRVLLNCNSVSTRRWLPSTGVPRDRDQEELEKTLMVRAHGNPDKYAAVEISVKVSMQLGHWK